MQTVKCEKSSRIIPQAFLLGILAIAIFVFIWNIRFVRAYYERKSSFKAFVRGDIETAFRLMSSASNRVPENNELGAMASFYNGILLIQQDKFSQSLASFDSCRNTLTTDEWKKILDAYMMKASIGAAFECNDYDKFLALTIENQKNNANDGFACAQVSSAYACKYAVTGEEQFKEKSLDMLKKARKLAENEAIFEEYQQRIFYRLYSREVITPGEFKKRFPNGWRDPNSKAGV